MIVDKRFIPDNVAARFCRGSRIFGIGSTLKGFIRNYKSGLPWYKCGPKFTVYDTLKRIASMADVERDIVSIVTACYPKEDDWEEGFKTRRPSK